MPTPKDTGGDNAGPVKGPIVGPVSPVDPVKPPVGPPIGPVPPIHFPPAAGTTPLSPSNPSVTTNAPTSSVAVTVPNTSGTVTFSLVVTDNLGVQSAPAFVTVTIQGAPVAVISTKPTTIGPGGAIELIGDGSKTSGTIASYTFSLVTPTPTPPIQ